MIKDVLFVWIPKNAGSSLVYSNSPLFTLTTSDYAPKNIGIWSNFKEGWLTIGHTGLRVILEKGLLDKKFLDRAFKFAIVRNPYRRFTSIHSHISGDKPFSVFCKQVKEQFEQRKLGMGSWINLPSLKNETNWSHANRQVDFVTDKNGKLLVDKVFKLEEIEEALNFLEKKTGVKLKMDRINIQPKKSPEQYYKSQKEIDIVKSLYEEDFKTFGYDKDYNISVLKKSKYWGK